MNARHKILPMKGSRSHGLMLVAAAAAWLLLSGPAANILHCRHRTAASSDPWDAVYLVCGARAQQRRLLALMQWMEDAPRPAPLILVGNDSHNSRWSRPHQRNLSRAEWAVDTLENWRSERDGPEGSTPAIRIVPGRFSNTDGEMQALATALHRTPDMQRIAIVTCRFHARRALRRLETHAPPGVIIATVPALPYWEDRAPWMVAAEYLKMLRDALGLTRVRWLTRAPEH